LAESCYSYMFYKCTNLNYIKCLATNISASYCTSKWVNLVSSTGTFVKHPSMNDWTTGINGIPEGWNIEDADMPYVTFTAEEDNSSIGLNKLSTKQTLEYSTDTTTWNTFDTTTNISLNNGDKVYIRGVLSDDNINTYSRFKMSGKIAASGNCNALWNYEDLEAPLKAYCGYFMFYSCTSLTTAPKLPTTELASYCYHNMFKGCTSLTTAPELPATTLARGCYYAMFRDCTSLTIAPELHAMELANQCYEDMFYSCTSLTTAPELPATTLAPYCYCEMFRNCTKLNYIKCLATDISASKCTSGWVDGVVSTGTFAKHPDMTSWSRGSSGIPSSWTVVDAEIS
jgi:hypothetical protein